MVQQGSEARFGSACCRGTLPYEGFVVLSCTPGRDDVARHFSVGKLTGGAGREDADWYFVGADPSYLILDSAGVAAIVQNKQWTSMSAQAGADRFVSDSKR